MRRAASTRARVIGIKGSNPGSSSKTPLVVIDKKSTVRRRRVSFRWLDEIDPNTGRPLRTGDERVFVIAERLAALVHHGPVRLPRKTYGQAVGVSYTRVNKVAQKDAGMELRTVRGIVGGMTPSGWPVSTKNHLVWWLLNEDVVLAGEPSPAELRRVLSGKAAPDERARIEHLAKKRGVEIAALQPPPPEIQIRAYAKRTEETLATARTAFDQYRSGAVPPGGLEWSSPGVIDIQTGVTARTERDLAEIISPPPGR